MKFKNINIVEFIIILIIIIILFILSSNLYNNYKYELKMSMFTKHIDNKLKTEE